jgi:hypothetical protein
MTLAIAYIVIIRMNVVEGDGCGLRHIRGQRTRQASTNGVGETSDRKTGAGGEEASGPAPHVASASSSLGVGGGAPAREDRVGAATPPYEDGLGGWGSRLGPTAHACDLGVASGGGTAKTLVGGGGGGAVSPDERYDERSSE